MGSDAAAQASARGGSPSRAGTPTRPDASQPGPSHPDPSRPGADTGDRIRSRTERSLRIVEHHAHDLFDRPLTDRQLGEIATAAESLAVLFGRLELPDLARLARHLITIVADDLPHDATTAARLAATCEDLRTLVDSAISQQRAVAADSTVVLVIGDPSDSTDVVCWIAQRRGHEVHQVSDWLPPADFAPDAIISLCPGRFTTATATRLRAVTGRWSAPLLVLHNEITNRRSKATRGLDGAGAGKLALFATTMLPIDAPPSVIADELGRAILAHRAPLRAVVWDDRPQSAERLSSEGFAVTEVDDHGQLLAALDTEPALVVLHRDLPTMTVATAVHLVRADPAHRAAPIVWLDPSTGSASGPSTGPSAGPSAGPPAGPPAGPSDERARWASRLDVTVAADLDPGLVSRVATHLRRLTGERAELVETGGTLLGWAAAQVLIDRALVAAHRSHSHVSLATVHLVPSLPPERVATIMEVLSTEFRRNDVLGRRDDGSVVIALDGVPRTVALSRVVSLLTRLDLDADSARAAIALFPTDGRSADELVRVADQAGELSARNDGPVVVSARWRPDADEAVDAVVVDADPVLSQVLVDLLTDGGLRATWYETGPELLAAFSTGQAEEGDGPGEPGDGAGGAVALPRLLLLDLDVIGINGLGLLRQMRAAGLLSQIKVILMMARSSEAELRAALDLGVVDVIHKPFSGTLLRHRIALILGETR